MPKTIKYVQQMMETLEEKRKRQQASEGDDATFYVEATRNDVLMSLKRDPKQGAEIVSVLRFMTPVLTIRRELSTQYKTGANLAVTLHAGAYSNSDRDCIATVLRELYAYQVTDVTNRKGIFSLHYVSQETTGEKTPMQLYCTDGEDATLVL